VIERSRFKLWLAQALPVVVVAAIAIATWQLIVNFTGIEPLLLPAPRQVFESAWQNGEALWRGFVVTATTAVAGLALSVVFGSLIAVLFSQARLLRNALYPYAIFLQTVPIVAIAPLLITWSGYQQRTVILVATIISLFPIVSNVTEGLTTLDGNLRDMFRLYDASRWSLLLKLRLPSAVPGLVQGMRISSGLAVIGAIVGEFFVGNGSNYDGLGTLMTGWQAQQKTAALIAAVLASTALGVLIFWMVNLLAATALSKWLPAKE